MSVKLAAGIVLVVLALAAYTIGVWSARRAGTLKIWHVPVLWAGLVCDTAGTTAMASLRGGSSLSLHGIIGYAAILLMAATTVIATIAAARRNGDKQRRSFPAFAVAAWAIWLMSFLTGLVINMRG